MKTFINVGDLGGLSQALAEAQEIKRDRVKYQQLGKNKTLLMILPAPGSSRPSAASSWTATRASTCSRPYP